MSYLIKRSLSPTCPPVEGDRSPCGCGATEGSWQADLVFEESESAVAGAVEDDVFIVTVRGDIDFDSARGLREALDGAGRTGTGRTVVDLSGLDFADSTVLHVLLGAQREHRTAGRGWWSPARSARRSDASSRSRARRTSSPWPRPSTPR